MEDIRSENRIQQKVEYRNKTTKENLKIFIQRNVMMLLIVLAYVVVAWIFNLPCPLRRVIRRPCPACGITRAWAQALRFNIKGAMEYHPLFWFVPFYVWTIINRDIWPIDKMPDKLYKVFTIVGGIFIFGLYIIRNIVGFGGV